MSVQEGFAILYCISLSRYMRDMEDILNPFMTGIFLTLLVSLCLVSFSIVTVRGTFLALYMHERLKGMIIRAKINYFLVFV
jgi:hypothetical protein